MLTVFISDPAKRRLVLPTVAVLIALAELRTWHGPWRWQLAATLALWAAVVALWVLATVRPHWAQVLGIGVCPAALVLVSHGVTAGVAVVGAAPPAGGGAAARAGAAPPAAPARGGGGGGPVPVP